MTFQDKKTTTAIGGKKLISSESLKITPNIKAAVEALVPLIETAFENKVHAVYYNEDKEKPGVPHSISIKFNTR